MALDIDKLKKEAERRLGMGKIIPVNVFGWDRKSYVNTIDIRDAEKLVFEGFAEPIRKNSIMILRTPKFRRKSRLYDELKQDFFGSARKKLEEVE